MLTAIFLACSVSKVISNHAGGANVGRVKAPVVRISPHILSEDTYGLEEIWKLRALEEKFKSPYEAKMTPTLRAIPALRKRGRYGEADKLIEKLLGDQLHFILLNGSNQLKSWLYGDLIEGRDYRTAFKLLRRFDIVNDRNLLIAAVGAHFGYGYPGEKRNLLSVARWPEGFSPPRNELDAIEGYQNSPRSFECLAWYVWGQRALELDSTNPDFPDDREAKLAFNNALALEPRNDALFLAVINTFVEANPRLALQMMDRRYHRRKANKGDQELLDRLMVRASYLISQEKSNATSGIKIVE